MEGKVVNKKNSIVVSILISLFSLLLVGGAVALVVYGANIVGKNLVAGIVLIVVGSVLAILLASGIICGVVFFVAGKTLPKGELLDEKLSIASCKNCGASISNNDRFCKKCGATTTEFKQCANCKILNKLESKVCTACGEKLPK